MRSEWGLSVCLSGILLTLGAHAQEGYCSWVCVSVCLSVKSHLTSGASVRPENTVVYSAGNGGQKICGVFFKTAPFKSYGVKRKLKSQLLIRSSLLWLTRDQVFLLDVQRSTSGYCMREYKHGYCSGQSNSASSSVQSQP